MRVRARTIWTLLACGLATLAAASAIALGDPPRHPSTSRHSTRAHGCAHRARTHGHASRRGRCKHRKARAPHRAPSPAPGGASSGGTPAGEERPPAGAPAEEGPAPPSVPRVQVAALEFHYTLSRASVPAGKVIFEFVNEGQDEHNLNVGSSEGSLELSFQTAQPKGVSDQPVVLKKGTYTLFCSLPEHEQKGMKASLKVE